VRVLLVDDSTPVRSRLVERLRESGLEVIGEAATAAGALEQTRALAPDAIVLDLQLPDRSGIDILPILRAEVPRACILVLTNAPAHYRRHCLALGADHFLDKSTEFELVVTVLLR
jgi:two-component system OmpR family response regulator